MSKKILWYTIFIISLVGFAALTSGFIQAINITVRKSEVIKEKLPEEKNIPQTPPTSSNSYSIVIMGDSIAKGTGDEKGKGFSTYLPDSLKNQTVKEIDTPLNVGIDGLQSKGLLDQLLSTKLNAVLSASDFVIISIGGNDIRTLQSLQDTAKEDEFNLLEKSYMEHLKKTIEIIRKNNKDTVLVFIGLYNPYEVKGNYEDPRLVNRWNGSTQELIADDPLAIFIPTYDLFKFNIKKYISADGLHPNSLGYQAISFRISKSLEGLMNRIGGN